MRFAVLAPCFTNPYCFTSRDFYELPATCGVRNSKRGGEGRGGWYSTLYSVGTSDLERLSSLKEISNIPIVTCPDVIYSVSVQSPHIPLSKGWFTRDVTCRARLGVHALISMRFVVGFWVYNCRFTRLTQVLSRKSRASCHGAIYIRYASLLSQIAREKLHRVNCP